MTIFVSDGLENIVEKGENAVFLRFVVLPQSFLRPISTGLLILSRRSHGYYVSAVQVF